MRHCPALWRLRQFDSPVLLWTGCDNEALAAICNPAFHAVLWIIHRNRALASHLGESFIQRAKIKENADPNVGAEQLLSAAVDSSQPLFLCFHSKTLQITLKKMPMEKFSTT